jgi:hypothetical protein
MKEREREVGRGGRVSFCWIVERYDRIKLSKRSRCPKKGPERTGRRDGATGTLTCKLI